MIARKFWFITGAGRNPGGDIAKAEPSHIHIPRTRRLRRPDDASAVVAATWGARASVEEYGAPPVNRSIEEARQ